MGIDYNKVIAVLTRSIDYQKKKSNSFIPKLYYHKHPNLVNDINNRYAIYNQQLDTMVAKKIFIVRPTKLVDIKKTKKPFEKIQGMYDLGVHNIHQLLSQL